MRMSGVACLFLAASIWAPRAALAQRAVIVVRHAEKVSETDQRLTEDGHARASRLAAMLKDAGVSAVYSTDTERTRDTVKPIGDTRRLPVRIYDEVTPFIQTLRRNHADDVVLVAAHSNTIPEILKALGCAGDVRISAEEYDNLFVVVPRAEGTATLLRLKY